MTAMHRYGVSAALKLIAVSSLVLGGTSLAEEQPITAVYKAKEVSFQYRISNRNYPCHELENRVANILRAVGARDDIDVQVRNCDAFMLGDESSMDPMAGRDNDPFSERDRWGASGGFRRPGDNRDPTVSVRVRLMMPVEVTPKVLEEIEKDKSRRELVSRVTGNPAAAFNDPVVFAAQRQEVTLSQRSIRLRAEDCELLEQMSNSVFRRLDVKVVRRSFSCGPRSESRIPPQMVAEALLPTGALLPMPDPEKEKEKNEDGAAQEPETKNETAQE
jgi:hypothetical protein